MARSSVSSEGGGDFRLRVPTGQLDTAIERLSRLGRVRNVSRNSLDITSTVVSARARLTDARTERESLLRQLAAADTVNETESIRARLDIVVARDRGCPQLAAPRAQPRELRQPAGRRSCPPAASTRAPGRRATRSTTPCGCSRSRPASRSSPLAIVLPLLALWLLAWLAHRVVVRRRRERSLDLA